MIRYASLSSLIDAVIQVAASPRGLCWLGFGDEAETRSELRRRFGAEVIRDEETLAGPAGALRAYFAGTLHIFDFPLDLRGTPFQLAVWEALRGIPYGETRSYRDIAAQIGRPTAVRAVAAANAANPVAIIVPCHRVIGADGRLRGYGGGLPIKQALLELEARSGTSSVPEPGSSLPVMLY